MELLYNPRELPEEEIRRTFVARRSLVDELVSLLEGQPEGAGVQHVILVAPRGMGKTTVLLMTEFALRDRGLHRQWQPVPFPEESYGIYDLGDFWRQTLQLLAAATGDSDLLAQAEALRSRYTGNVDLQEAAVALLKDWSRQHGRRLLLLVDNFDMILQQISSEDDNARLRNVLMNEGWLMLIGGATTFFHEARAHDQPLYEFFTRYELAPLAFSDMEDLLRRRAEIDRQPEFEATLTANRPRLKALEYFTGGNPRLVLMLYRVMVRSQVTEVREGLEKLLDEVTPYYKAKAEALSPQQRKILDAIARAGAQTREGLTPSAIAQATRLTPNQASSQLKRLARQGYVVTANLRGRSSWYTLSEPLYAIWRQMRFGFDARQKMQWLIGFLQVYYSQAELSSESHRLATQFDELIGTGKLRSARELMEFRGYLVEAMRAEETCRQERAVLAASYRSLAQAVEEKGDWAAALKEYDSALLAVPNDATLHERRGLALGRLERHKDALASFEKALELDPKVALAWYNRGVALDSLERHKDALASFEKALELDPKDASAWYNRGVALMKLRRNGDALASFAEVKRLGVDQPSLFAAATASSCQIALRRGEYGLARQEFADLAGAVEKAPDEFFRIVVLLLSAARQGHVEFVEKAIREADLVERLLPLLRAIEYLRTNDEALVEKLSPEVKGVVMDIVEELRETSDE